MAVVVYAVWAEPVPASAVTVSACMSATVPAVADVAVAVSVPELRRYAGCVVVGAVAVAAVPKVCCASCSIRSKRLPFVHRLVGRHHFVNFLQLGGIACDACVSTLTASRWFLANQFFRLLQSFSYFSCFRAFFLRSLLSLPWQPLLAAALSASASNCAMLEISPHVFCIGLVTACRNPCIKVPAVCP